MRKRYDDQFKQQMVKLYLSEGRTYRSLQEEYGVDKATLRAWVKAYEDASSSDPAIANESELMRQNRELKRKNAELEKENLFLKKTAAFFAKEQII